MTVRRIYELTRYCTSSDDGVRTLFFKSSGDGTRRHPGFFLRPEQVPQFEGERAWFLCEREVGGYWRAVQRVEQQGHLFQDRPGAESRDL